MFCTNCGRSVLDSKFCPYCGEPVEGPADVTTTEAEQPKESLAEAETTAAEAPAETLGSTSSPTAAAFAKYSVSGTSNAPWAKNAPSPWTSSAPAQNSVSAAPAQNPAFAAPATTETPAVPAAPVEQNTAPAFNPDQVAPGVTTIYDEPKKKKSPLLPVFIAVGGVLALALIAGGIFAIWHYSRVSKYNAGVEAIDAGDYEKALELFNGVLDFEDADYYARMAQVEIDNQKVDELLEKGDYDGAIKILKTVESFYKGEDKGKEATLLMYECTSAQEAEEAYKNKDYATAKSKFDVLKRLKDRYKTEPAICEAYVAEKDQDWYTMLKAMYGIQIQDFEYKFVTDPQTDEAKILADAINNGTDDYNTIEGIMKPETDEQKAIVATAINGLKYDYACKLLDDKKYEDAKDIFGELGDFLDSPLKYETCTKKIAEVERIIKTYEQAEKYFKDGYYYKAYAAYSSIQGYKDASEKMKKCQQTMPKNGSMKKGSSGCKLTIKNPPYNALLRIYNSKGKVVGQVFLRAGKSATIKVKPGTYTMRIAYGTKWYGSKDLFGDSGSYLRLRSSATSYNFKFKKNYRYTLTLQTWNGNVGSENIAGGASGM